MHIEFKGLWGSQMYISLLYWLLYIGSSNNYYKVSRNCEHSLSSHMGMKLMDRKLKAGASFGGTSIKENECIDGCTCGWSP